MKELRFVRGQLQESDLYDLSAGIAAEPYVESTAVACRWSGAAQGLHPLLETVRYHNNTLDEVRLSFPTETYDGSKSSSTRHPAFTRRSVRRVRRSISDTPWTPPPPPDAETAFRPWWWPLLGSNHPTVKATVLFGVLRGGRSRTRGPNPGEQRHRPSTAAAETTE